MKNFIQAVQTDINAAFEGLISTLFYLDDVLSNKSGRRNLDGANIVSGGLLARKNEFVVDNIFKPNFKWTGRIYSPN